MKHESILSQLIVAAIYITLGIPLIVTSTQSPQILEPADFEKNFSKSGTAICVSKDVLNPKTGAPVSANNINSTSLKNMASADKKLASSLNASRSCSLVVGIILLCFAFLNIVSALVPKKMRK